LARDVVVVGVEASAYVPEPLSALPTSLCTLSSAHQKLAAFRAKEVIAVSAGQSALESPALLHENGVAVKVLARERELAWNGEPLSLDRPLLQRLTEPGAGLGSGTLGQRSPADWRDSHPRGHSLPGWQVSNG